MSKKEPTNDVDSEELGGYVPVVYARSFEQAEWYCQLLEDHDIPAIMDEDYEPPQSDGTSHRHGIPVLVPESMLGDARTCIAQLEEIEGFCEDDEDEDEEDEFGQGKGFDAERHEKHDEHEGEEEYFG